MTFHISYPAELPVSERREDLMAAIAANQVTIIAGETGSGKTTQIPKMCLELGLGENGLIGHTQPRRLAARTVAERIASELGVDIGQEVGFQVRFTGEVSKSTKVKLMTDGILLAEIQRDKLLRKYNAIIIDEAHERSLNIDFILGYLKRILPQRPDLKVIITSATIDPERFAKHFGSDEEPAPIVEVSGRTFPVEIRYRPLSQPRAARPRTMTRTTPPTMNSRKTATRWTRCATPSTSSPLKRRATSSSSSPASGRSATPRTPCRPGSSPTGGWPAPKSCRCSRG
jgi:ATP-dependent helicase HrpA